MSYSSCPRSFLVLPAFSTSFSSKVITSTEWSRWLISEILSLASCKEKEQGEIKNNQRRNFLQVFINTNIWLCMTFSLLQSMNPFIWLSIWLWPYCNSSPRNHRTIISLQQCTQHTFMFWLLWSSSAMVVSLLSSSCAFICEASGPEGTLGADDGGMSLDRLLSRLELREDGLEAAPAPSMFLHTTTSSQSHFPPTANALCKWQCQKLCWDCNTECHVPMAVLMMYE